MDHAVHSRMPATYADLVALPSHIKGEIIDGRLYTQPRPRAWHAMIEGAAFGDLHACFHRGRGGPGGWWIVVEPGIELPRAPEFSPDSAGWLRSRMPRPPGPGEPWRTVPDFIFEVLSPSNRHYDLTVKRRFYAEIGVQHLWFIDPDARTLMVNRLHEGRWVELGVFGSQAPVRAEPFDAVELDIGEWWPTHDGA
ncbi:MAG TPA: Uma2 family endonuclease [Nannocystis sp.]